ncbi:MAG: hypothetical protein GF320_02410 [Armatimonadia bacterium]|nr:hypothetical protein [Armatimonadia bacterium]
MTRNPSHRPYGRAIWLFLGAAVVAAVLAGCAGGGSGSLDLPATPLEPIDEATPDYDRRPDPWTKPAQPITEAEIRVELPDAAAAELDLVTVAGRRSLSESTTVTVPVASSDGGIVGILVAKDTGAPAAVAYVPPSEEPDRRVLSSREIALGNVYISPAVMMAPADERARILSTASASEDLAPVQAEAEELLSTRPTAYLSAAVASGGLRLATDVSVAAARAVVSTRADIGSLAAPNLEDLPGQDVNLVNPRLTAYGYRIETSEGEVVVDGLLYGRANYFTAVPRWPFIEKSLPVKEAVSLPDGQYVISFYKGLNLDAPAEDVIDPDTPWGQASLVNSLNLTTVVSDALGFFPQDDPAIEEWQDRVQDVLEALGEVADPRDLEASLQTMHLSDVLLTVLEFSVGVGLTDVLIDLVEGIEDAGIAEGFFRLMRDVYAIADQVYVAVQFAYTDVGYVYDLFAAPFTVKYVVRQTDGVLQEVVEE